MRTPVYVSIFVLATALAAAPGVAQEPTGLFRVLGLPRATQEARVLGVPETDIRVILGTARERGVAPALIVDVIEESNQVIREHGPVDNFGAFVQARLNEGLRGRELAAAIRAEHAERGKGKGHVGGPGGSAVGAGGKPGSPGKSTSAQSGSPGKSGKSASKEAKEKKGGPR